MMQTAGNERSDNAIRKAAILIATLDTNTADELLDKMSAEQAAQVRQAVMELEEIGADEEGEIIREFLGGDNHSDLDDGDGVELDQSLARKLNSTIEYENAANLPPPPFRALCEASVDAVSRQLQRQHPQVVALVVAHLPAARAAEIVKRLSPQLQADVLRRVADLDATDPEVIRDIDHELELLLSGDIRQARNRTAGLSTVAAIVQAAGTQGHGLLGNLAQHDRHLASQLRDTVQPPVREEQPAAVVRVSRRAENPAPRGVAAPTNKSRTTRRNTDRHSGKPTPSLPRVAFEELALLSDDDWAALIRVLEPETLFLALAGADEQLIARMTQQLPGREAQALRRRLEQIGPVKLSDIDHAQQLVAQRAAQLIAQGKVANPRPRNFAAAA